MSFDILARHYRWMELLLAGDKLQRARLAFLDSIAGVGSVLLVGEGHGRFLAECVQRLPGAKITVLDASVKMLKEAEARLKDARAESGRVQFVHANILDWIPPNERFDAVVTQFFLDCFPEEQLAGVVRKLAASASQRSTWLLADFQIPSRGAARLRAQAIHASMYLFFRFVTRLPARRWIDPDHLLRENGFGLRRRETSEWGLLRSDFWQRGAIQGSSEAT